MQRWAAVGVIVVSILVWSFVAHAEPSEADLQTARALFAKVRDDEAAHNWQAALEKLERIAKIKTTAGILAHIAGCEENLCRLRVALRDYERALVLARAKNMPIEQQVIEEALTRLRSHESEIAATCIGSA